MNSEDFAKHTTSALFINVHAQGLVMDGSQLCKRILENKADFQLTARKTEENEQNWMNWNRL